MKNARLSAITDIITENEISTQEDLIAHLNARGFDVTQATVSRDIKTLRLVKTSNKQGRSVYVTQSSVPSASINRSYFNVFKESVLDIRAAGSIVVIKCHNGMGNAACEAIDVMGFTEIVGTIAGDNTIFAAVDNNATAQKLLEKIKSLL